MDYAEIVKAIKAYEKMTPAEVQEAIKPIIKRHDVKFIAEILGISVGAVYQYNKKCYVEAGHKPTFEHYVILMNLNTMEE